MSLPSPIKFEIVTLSDRASRGEYEDLSGPEIGHLIQEYFESIKQEISLHHALIPDEPDQLRDLIGLALKNKVQVVFTSGGTGLGKRDFTPEVIREFLDKEIPGIMEMIRVKYGAAKPNALVSRSVAGVSGETLVFALPGSLKAVGEYMAEILPTILHALRMIYGLDDHS